VWSIIVLDFRPNYPLQTDRLAATAERVVSFLMKADDIQIVVEDLQYLREGWGKEISDPEARRGSAVLRRLLVEDAYGQAWRAIGFPRQPKVIAVDIKHFLGGASRSDVDIALAGGVTVRAASMVGLCVFKRPCAVNPTPPLTLNGFLGEREYTLSEYLDSETGIVQGRTATRRDVVKYFANVKGGVHLGAKQRRTEKDLVARMKRFEKKVSLFQKDGLLFELVAIGQAIGRSPDRGRFIEKANSALQRPSR